MVGGARGRSFDRKFGREFMDLVPSLPGTYRIYDESGALIYVGKAKNLKRRLSQYRNAKRLKRHSKMRKIVADAAKLEFTVAPGELEACLEENRLIQEHRPRWNIAGAFHFLYPLIGVRHDITGTYFCYTTQPEALAGFEFHGAFRSREITGAAFFALMKLLGHVGHVIQKKKLPRAPRYSYVFGFRQIPPGWVSRLADFLKGESPEALGELVLALVESASARRSKRATQELLNELKRFWKHEAVPLRKARTASAYSGYPVAQRDRDPLFLRLRYPGS